MHEVRKIEVHHQYMKLSYTVEEGIELIANVCKHINFNAHTFTQQASRDVNNLAIVLIGRELTEQEEERLIR